MAIAYEQGELFATASDKEIEETEFYLERYRDMILFIEDFNGFQSEMAQVAVDGEVARRLSADELYADKTANAVILTEKQKWMYERYRVYTFMIFRAYNLIPHQGIKKVIKARFIEGHNRSNTILFTYSSGSTVDRYIERGTKMIANSLVQMGFFDEILKRN
ncbi:hypothetical protein MHH60_31960 [Paenibacillus sp. FSL H7-0716]|uniref:TetR family transcriptional regulator n=1 Tax=Paenibacillus odorifer TaxID=189426 RepID=A0AB36J3Q4_9BACL|nr:hypothetical protein [Paenibacillus odorifer]OME10143.1 hypothetical protein BSK47_31205 [Paenibacillus odorifer]